MDQQDFDYHWFEENREKLFLQYPNKHLIISNKEVIGAYDSFDEAFKVATISLAPGEFIIQESEEEQTILFSFTNSVLFA